MKRLQPPYICMDEEDVPEKVKIYGFISYHLLLIAYVAVSINYIFKAKNDFENNTYDYFLLLENWRQPIITDIISTNNSYCPSGYSNLIPYQWGGSEVGCNCINSIKLKKITEGWADIAKGLCSSDQYLYQCSSIAPQSPKEMPLWYNNNLLCVKREKNETFENRANLLEKSGQCAKGYQKCGKGNGFNEDRVFCTASGKCPINSIALSKASPGGNYNESIEFNTKNGEGYRLFISRLEENASPIVEWRVSEEKICLNNKANYLSSKHNEYILVNNQRSRCAEFDDRFKLLDSLSEREFFAFNHFENIGTLLPSYSLSDDISWNLYYRSIIDFKIQCRDLMFDLINLEDEAKDIAKFINSSTITITVFVGILGLFYLVAAYLILDGNGDCDVDFCNIFIFLLNYTVRIVSLSLSGYDKTLVTNFANLFSSMKDMNCSDEITNNFFKNLANDLNSSAMYDLNIVVFFNVALISLDIFTIVLSLWAKGSLDCFSFDCSCDCLKFRKDENNLSNQVSSANSRDFRGNNGIKSDDIQVEIPYMKR